ncbi:uncharacterized protein LOC127790332 [Diospyros lotus]|uniref:uncharacterized protein LOC127790332 n=1 Tax=Diospyros lotus TaxID=55363 RepID=UPI002257BA00|nr:uncharacterized protein LOC127790332 [Diospyros lotus]
MPSRAWSGGTGDDATIPDLHEGSDDHFMVSRRVELEEAVEERLEVVLRADVSLQDHLEHGLPEIEIGIVGVLDDGDAVGDFGIGVRGAMRGGEVDVNVECGGRNGGVVFVFAGFFPGTW